MTFPSDFSPARRCLLHKELKEDFFFFTLSNLWALHTRSSPLSNPRLHCPNHLTPTQTRLKSQNPVYFDSPNRTFRLSPSLFLQFSLNLSLPSSATQHWYAPQNPNPNFWNQCRLLTVLNFGQGVIWCWFDWICVRFFPF